MMTSFDQTDPDYSVYAAMVEGQFGAVPNLSVAAGDEMYAFSEQTCGSRILGLMAYFRAGMQINDAVRQLITWHFGAPAKVSRFLDFASGYGRSTRFLQHDLGPSAVWAADILPNAIDFQKQQFGVHTIASTTKPENFRPGMQFDCIFVSSLFSHLPETTFTRWLWKLYSLLAPGGLLIFSVHNEATLPAGVAMPRSGIHFMPLTEIPSLDVGDYGATVVADHFVQTAIHAVTGIGEHTRIAQGLCFTQDLYVVAKGKLKTGPVPFQYGPNGCLDFCRWTEPEQMKLTGWAFDATEGQRIERVEVHYNGVLRGSCELNHFRPDVAAFLGHSGNAEAVRSGWDCRIELNGEKIRPEQDWVLVKAFSSSGKQFVLRMDHPSNVSEFESMQGWTYTESEGGSQAITAVLRYLDHPRGGRFISADPVLSGWIATKEKQAFHGLRLEGRFGAIPFTETERPDVETAFAGFNAMGFQVVLPLEYLTVSDPRLRFVTSSGVVLATLDTLCEASAGEAVKALRAAREVKRQWCLANGMPASMGIDSPNVKGLTAEEGRWNNSWINDGMDESHAAELFDKAQQDTQGAQRVLVCGAGYQGVVSETMVFLDPVRAPSTDILSQSTKLPFHDGVFDAVVYIRSFTEPSDPAAVAAEFTRVLKQSGVIYSEGGLLTEGRPAGGTLECFEQDKVAKSFMAMCS